MWNVLVKNKKWPTNQCFPTTFEKNATIRWTGVPVAVHVSRFRSVWPALDHHAQIRIFSVERFMQRFVVFEDRHSADVFQSVGGAHKGQNRRKLVVVVLDDLVIEALGDYKIAVEYKLDLAFLCYREIWFVTVEAVKRDVAFALLRHQVLYW